MTPDRVRDDFSDSLILRTVVIDGVIHADGLRGSVHFGPLTTMCGREYRDYRWSWRPSLTLGRLTLSGRARWRETKHGGYLSLDEITCGDCKKHAFGIPGEVDDP